MGSVRFRSLFPTLLRRAASRRRMPHPLRGRGDEARTAYRRRVGRGRCRHRPKSHSIFLRLASRPTSDGLGIYGRQYCLARIGTTAERDALAMASLLERYARGIPDGLSSSRRSNASSTRQSRSQTGFDLRSPRANMGRCDHVLLRGIHHRAARRVRSGMRRLCALCKARRCFGRGLPRTLGRICRERKPISRFVSIRRVNNERICAPC